MHIKWHLWEQDEQCACVLWRSSRRDSVSFTQDFQRLTIIPEENNNLRLLCFAQTELPSPLELNTPSRISKSVTEHCCCGKRSDKANKEYRKFRDGLRDHDGADRQHREFKDDLRNRDRANKGLRVPPTPKGGAVAGTTALREGSTGLGSTTLGSAGTTSLGVLRLGWSWLLWSMSDQATCSLELGTHNLPQKCSGDFWVVMVRSSSTSPTVKGDPFNKLAKGPQRTTDVK